MVVNDQPRRHTPRFACLHAHSLASDGVFSPVVVREVVESLSIRHWALTDHDTLRGYAELRDQQGERQSGSRLWPGVEMTVYDPLFHQFGHCTVLFPDWLYDRMYPLVQRGRGATTINELAKLPVLLLSGCAGSIVYRHAQTCNTSYWYGVAHVLAHWYSLFTDRLYIEVQAPFFEPQFIELARIFRLKVIATTDSHGTTALPFLGNDQVRALHPDPLWQQAVSRTMAVVDHLRQLDIQGR